MKKYKQILALVLVLMLTITLFACNKTENKGEYIFSLEKAKINGNEVDKYALYEADDENINLEGRFIYIKILH